MGETLTTIHRLLGDNYPFIDLEACGQADHPNLDIPDQAFLISLGSLPLAEALPMLAGEC
jgi:hypothetical protein